MFAVVNDYGTEIMDVLLKRGACFKFRGVRSRDAIAPILTNWVYNLSPSGIPALVDTLLVAGCVDHERARCVVSSLLWSRHTQDALLFLFLALFSTASSQQAATDKVLYGCCVEDLL